MISIKGHHLQMLKGSCIYVLKFAIRGNFYHLKLQNYRNINNMKNLYDLINYKNIFLI